MKTKTSLIIGMFLVVSGFASFCITSYLLDHGYLVESAFVYHRADDSQFDNELARWGMFAYLRIGLLIIGYVGIGSLAINGVIFLIRKIRK